VAKTTAEQTARKAARDAQLVELGRAIVEGRAFLDTFQGRKKVVGYDDRNGWATTNDGGGYLNNQGWMVCLDRFVILPA